MQIHRSRYSLVLSTLQPLLKTAPTRKCYRQIGGTLVERTVADVVPSLETNYSGIKEVLEGLAKSYQSREKAFVDFQKEYGIQVCDASEPSLVRRPSCGVPEERSGLTVARTPKYGRRGLVLISLDGRKCSSASAIRAKTRYPVAHLMNSCSGQIAPL